MFKRTDHTLHICPLSGQCSRWPVDACTDIRYRPAIMLEHTITFRVRYPECDPIGVVHHSRFFQYFEMGRIELLRATGFSYADMEKSGVFFVVAKAECAYRSPARYDDQLTLVTRVRKQTAVRFEHEYLLKRDETVLAQGVTTIACVDAKGVLREIPESLRQAE